MIMGVALKPALSNYWLANAALKTKQCQEACLNRFPACIQDQSKRMTEVE